MGKIANGYSITGQDLFINYTKKLYNVPIDEIISFFNRGHRKYVMSTIFYYGLIIILKDIIANNITFRLPTRKEAFIRVETLGKEEFTRARQNGAHKEVDFLASNFTANVLRYRFKSKDVWKIKKIYVGKWLKDKLTEFTNEGRTFN